MKDITFGQCLKLLLSALDINMSRLSKAINIDSSLVSRWVHEKRVPACGTCYVEDISNYLSSHIHNDAQVKLINELLAAPCEPGNSREDIKKKIKDKLLEAQNYSIGLSKGTNANRKKNTINLSNHIETKIVQEVDNFFAASLPLIESAANRKARKGDKIYITYSSSSDFYFSNKKELIPWRQAMLKAFDNGWELCYMIKINNNMERTIAFVNFIFSLIYTGKVHLYYFDNYAFFPDDRDFCVVSNTGVLSCFPRLLGSNLYPTFLVRNKEAAEVLENYIKVLIKKNAKKLLNHYFKDSIKEYLPGILEAKKSFGEQLDLNYGDYLLMVPENLYERLLFKRNLPIAERQLLQSHYKRQREAFLRNLQHCSFKAIHYIETIDSLFKNKCIHVRGYYGIEKIELDDRDIIALIENIINFLNRYDNYHVAAIFQNKNSPTEVEALSFMVKTKQAVFFNAFNPSDPTEEIRFSIEEPMIALAFEKYFNDIWDRISPICKDKKEIISRLQSYINLLKVSITAPVFIKNQTSIF